MAGMRIAKDISSVITCLIVHASPGACFAKEDPCDVSGTKQSAFCQADALLSKSRAEFKEWIKKYKDRAEPKNGSWATDFEKSATEFSEAYAEMSAFASRFGSESGAIVAKEQSRFFADLLQKLKAREASKERFPLEDAAYRRADDALNSAYKSTLAKCRGIESEWKRRELELKSEFPLDQHCYSDLQLMQRRWILFRDHFESLCKALGWSSHLVQLTQEQTEFLLSIEFE